MAHSILPSDSLGSKATVRTVKTMPALTRHRDPAAHDETWLIHYGDIHVGTIRLRMGVPTNVDQWGWTIGFHPASLRGLRASGTAKGFDMARGAFETAWR